MIQYWSLTLTVSTDLGTKLCCGICVTQDWVFHFLLLACLFNNHAYQSSLDELILACLSILLLSAPGFEGGGLQGTAVWEGQSPGPVQRAHVHGIQVDGGLLLTLATRQESNACTGRAWEFSFSLYLSECQANYPIKNSLFVEISKVFITFCVCNICTSTREYRVHLAHQGLQGAQCGAGQSLSP